MNFLNRPIGLIIGLTLIGVTPLILHSKIDKRKFALLGLIYTSSLGSIIVEILKDRTLAFQPYSYYLIEQTNASIFFNEANTFLCFYFSFVAILFRLLRRKNGKLNISKNSVFLYTTLLIFYFGLTLSSIFSVNPGISEELIKIPIFFLGVICTMPIQHEWLMKHIHVAFLFFLYGSILSAIFVPNWTFEPYYDSIFPGLEIRLYGVASHPKGLGFISAIVILVSIYLSKLKIENKWLAYLNIFLSIILLILSQSRTIWIAVFIAFTFYLFWEAKSTRFEIKKEFAFGLLSVLLMIIIGIVGLIYQDLIIDYFSSDFFITLNDRMPIWLILFDVFRKNPIFGFGEPLWMEATRGQLFSNYFLAGHAHNVFIHILATYGIVGFLTMLVYWFALLYSAYKLSNVTKGLSICFLILLIIQSFTEVSFLNTSGDMFFIHLVLFTYFVSLFEKYRLDNRKLLSNPYIGKYSVEVK